MKTATYTLKLTEDQARRLAGACEFYARMCLGQWQELVQLCMEMNRPDYLAASELLEKQLLDARKTAMPDLEKTFGHSYGVGKFRDADVVWEIYEVIRNKIAWTEHPEGGSTVDFSPPMSFSGVPLAVCEVKKEARQ